MEETYFITQSLAKIIFNNFNNCLDYRVHGCSFSPSRYLNVINQCSDKVKLKWLFSKPSQGTILKTMFSLLRGSLFVCSFSFKIISCLFCIFVLIWVYTIVNSCRTVVVSMLYVYTHHNFHINKNLIYPIFPLLSLTRFFYKG